jgi:hypothetical protein
MNRLLTVSACALASAVLSGCEARERAMSDRERAAKSSQAAAAARDTASLVGSSPDAVATSRPDGDGTAEVRKPVLAPTEGATALRNAATKLSGAASGAGPREAAAAQALAARLRLEALALEQAEAERIAGIASSVALEAAGARLSAAQLESGASATALSARAGAARQDAGAYEAGRAQLKALAEAAKQSLDALDAKIKADDEAAEALDAEILALRGEAAVAPAERALPLMLEARQKLDEAQARRLAASAAELEAEQHRSAVRVAQSALGGDDSADTYLVGRADDLDKAAKALGAAAAATKEESRRLTEFAAQRAEAFRRIRAEEFEPAAKRVEEAFAAGGLPSKDPLDTARVALMRARFAALQANMLRAEAMLSEDRPSADATSRESSLMAQAKAALIEARDALAGVEAERGGTMLASATGMAGALGIDLSTPDTPPPAVEGGDASASEQAADAPPADAPADPPAEEPAPADAPAEPTEPPAGEPAPGDVPPEDQPKA